MKIFCRSKLRSPMRVSPRNGLKNNYLRVQELKFRSADVAKSRTELRVRWIYYPTHRRFPPSHSTPSHLSLSTVLCVHRAACFVEELFLLVSVRTKRHLLLSSTMGRGKMRASSLIQLVAAFSFQWATQHQAEAHPLCFFDDRPTDLTRQNNFCPKAQDG